MFVTVTGGSGSGKSEYSENLLLRLDGKRKGGRFYLATMFPYDEESHKRIERHRDMRKDKGFTTIECYKELVNLSLPAEGGRPSALLECMSNLAANECFMEGGAGVCSAQEILKGIRRLLAQTENLVVVTNEVFSDGTVYDAETENYRQILGQVNRGLSALSDAFIEVVYGIPVFHKGALL